MDNIDRAAAPFDSIKHKTNKGVDYWEARELQPLLGYQDWRYFEEVIQKARMACEVTGAEARRHFVARTKKVTTPRSSACFGIPLLPCVELGEVAHHLVVGHVYDAFGGAAFYAAAECLTRRPRGVGASGGRQV